MSGRRRPRETRSRSDGCPDDRSNQQERSLKLRRKQREQGVQPEKKEIRARNRLDNCRIGLAGRSKGSKDDGAEGHRQQDATGKDQVLPDRVRHEGHTVLVSQFLVLLQVSLAPHQPAGHRPFIDPELEHHEQMQAHEPDQHPRDHEHMQGEEAGERRAGDDGTAQQQTHQPAAHQRHATHDRGADSQSPIRVLVETQHLAGKSHAERHQQQENAHRPGEFPRILVGSKEEHLNHVDEYQGNHEV